MKRQLINKELKQYIEENHSRRDYNGELLCNTGLQITNCKDTSPLDEFGNTILQYELE